MVRCGHTVCDSRRERKRLDVSGTRVRVENTVCPIMLLDVLVKGKGKQKLITEEKRQSWMDGQTNHSMGSIRQKLIGKA